LVAGGGELGHSPDGENAVCPTAPGCAGQTLGRINYPIGMAVQKGNTALLEQANEFIATFNDAGGLYEVLAAKFDPVILEALGKYGLEFYINEN
jgi:hypothetical protein